MAGIDPTGYASCSVSDLDCKLDDGLNTLVMEDGSKQNLYIGTTGEKVEFRFSSGGTTTGTVGDNGGDIGSRRVNGSFSTATETYAASDIGASHTRRAEVLGGGRAAQSDVAAETFGVLRDGKCAFGDSYAADFGRHFMESIFGGRVNAPGDDSIESWATLPLPQAKAAGGIAMAGGFAMSAMRRAAVPDASNYRSLFRAARPDLPSDWHVHHSLPQRYEELLRAAGVNIHDPQFLRGVSPQLHARITTEWGRFHRLQGGDPTAANIADFAKQIDKKYGDYFVWPGY